MNTAWSEGGGLEAGADSGEALPGLVHVVFKGRRIEPFLNPESLPLESGSDVIVEVERGFDLGKVRIVSGADIRPRKTSEPRRILRLATPEELVQFQELRAQDDEALRTVKGRVAHFGLPMHLVDAEFQFDRNRVTFYFTADHRIDFRELVRDLAGIFRTRIELRQINTREAARRLGGVGFCGRGLCCCCFLCDFERVSLQMARGQRTSINPSRLSGLCGRLLCCLTFETTPDGEAPSPCYPAEGGDGCAADGSAAGNGGCAARNSGSGDEGCAGCAEP